MAWPHIIAFNMFAFAALAASLFITTYSDIKIAKNKVQIAQQLAQQKRIAFSFDDVPRGPGAFLDIAQRPAMLIKSLQDGGVKGAAFFANPGRNSGINKGAENIAAYTAAGHVIGNHTNNHVALSAVSPAAFLADVAAAETWLKPHANYRPWFRFPRLDEGRKDKTKRDAARAGLKQLGIRNAYVTADGWDWFMESRAIAAKRAGKPMDMAALRQLYIETHVESANFSDRLAQRILGRRPVQILLLHETDLAALYVDDLAKALRADGWQIVSNDTAYADPMAQMIPDPEFADGTMLEMLAWEKGLTGGRWFPRNNEPMARKLFATRVLGE
jgi:peptidoglycan/xylan/chitin deacetylase (PgdA/CDA1 family)